MAESTITGRGGTKAQDARKMEQLSANIRGILLLLNVYILCGHFVNTVSWITTMHILSCSQVDAFTSVHFFLVNVPLFLPVYVPHF